MGAYLLRRLLLVVEDDDRFAAIVRDLARELGFQCLVASTADVLPVISRLADDQNPAVLADVVCEAVGAAGRVATGRRDQQDQRPWTATCSTTPCTRAVTCP